MQSLDEEMNDLINDEELVESEDEREKQEEEKERFEVSVTFNTPVPSQVKSVLLCPQGQAQALVKIILHERMSQIGVVECLYHEKKHEVVKLLHSAEFQLLVLLPTDHLKGAFTNQVVDQLFGQYLGSTKYERIVVIDSLYKTQYSTTDTGHLELSSGDNHYPLKYYKTSWADKDASLLALTQKTAPAGVLNLIGGLPAAVIIHAELNGIPAAEFLAVVDSHYVTSETLQAFTPVVHEVLGLNQIKMSDIHRMAAFKDALKEANNRNNNIYN